MAYSAAQAARLAGCSVSQLRHWARRGLVEPSAPDRQYDFRDLVALRIVRSLLDAGLPSARVGIALRAVVDAGDDIASLRLVTDGATVWVCHDDGQILDALRAGQLALFVAVDRVAADMEAEVRAFDRERSDFVAHLRDDSEATEVRSGAEGAPSKGGGRGRGEGSVESTRKRRDEMG